MLLKDSVAAKKAAKAQKPAPVEVTTDAPKDPAWDEVRAVTTQMSLHGRMFLRCQVRLGMLLAGLKKRHGVVNGKHLSSLPDSGKEKSWPDTVKDESGYSRQSADVFMKLADSARAKLKASKKLKLPDVAKKDALVLFQADPLTLSTEQWDIVDGVIGTLTDGETQASLMQHLGLISVPKPMPKGEKKADADVEQPTAGQLAFHFFGAVASPLINARSNPDYKKLLMALPTDSTEDAPLSLATLAAEARAFLADIEEITTANLKAARGRTVS